MRIYSESPQSIGAVIDAGMRLFKRSFTKLFPLVLVTTVISSLPMIFIFMAIGSTQPTPEQLSQVMSGMGGLFTVTSLISLILYGAMAHRVHIIAQGKLSSLGGSLMAATKASLWLLLSMILYVIAIMVGSVLLLVPGIIIMVSGMFFIYATMIDGKKGLAALRYSHQMVWGSWWRTSVILAVVTILTLVFAMLAGVGVGLLAAFVPVLAGEMVGMFMQLAANLLIMPIAMPLTVAVMAVTYNDLKLRKQGGDLKARIAEPKQDDDHHGMAGVHPVAHG